MYDRFVYVIERLQKDHGIETPFSDEARQKLSELEKLFDVRRDKTREAFADSVAGDNKPIIIPSFPSLRPVLSGYDISARQRSENAEDQPNINELVNRKQQDKKIFVNKIRQSSLNLATSQDAENYPANRELHNQIIQCKPFDANHSGNEIQQKLDSLVPKKTNINKSFIKIESKSLLKQNKMIRKKEKTKDAKAKLNVIAQQNERLLEKNYRTMFAVCASMNNKIDCGIPLNRNEENQLKSAYWELNATKTRYDKLPRKLMENPDNLKDLFTMAESFSDTPDGRCKNITGHNFISAPAAHSTRLKEMVAKNVVLSNEELAGIVRKGDAILRNLKKFDMQKEFDDYVLLYDIRYNKLKEIKQVSEKTIDHVNRKI